MTGKYAQGTEVSTGRSRDEIERTLQRYGATSFAYGWDRDIALVGFVAHDRQIRFTLPMPNRDEFRHTPTGRPRSDSQVDAEHEKAQRQRWRALALVIKAKLEAVETGIVTFEEEFAPHMVLPDGSLVKDHLLPQIAEAYKTGKVPQLLPGR